MSNRVLTNHVRYSDNEQEERLAHLEEKLDRLLNSRSVNNTVCVDHT